MVQIQLDINEALDKQLRIYMAYNDINSKSEGIKAMMTEYILIRPPKFKSR